MEDGKHFKRLEEAALEGETKARGLEAAATALKLIKGRPVIVNGIPIQELVALELGIENPDRIGAQRTVDELLEVGTQELSVAQESRRHRAIDARLMLPRPESGPPAEQIH